MKNVSLLFKKTLKGLASLFYALTKTGTMLAILIITMIALVIYIESQNSPIQSKLFKKRSQDISWTTEQGAASEMILPQHGPLNVRRGYTEIPTYVQALNEKGYAVEQQSRQSDGFQHIAEQGYVPPFDPKQQTGITLSTRDQRDLYRTAYPVHTYTTFEQIPQIVLTTLFFIEDRNMLAKQHPNRNPVIDWDRLALAGMEYAKDQFGYQRNVPGASTLLTQYYKFTHSKGGQTHGVQDKWRQMYSASLYVYKADEDKQAQTKKAVLNYINHIPLSGQKNWGSVHGLGDALHAYFGQDFERANTQLNEMEPNKQTAQTLRQVASIFVAQRRPTYYFNHPVELHHKVNTYLRKMAKYGHITPQMLSLTMAHMANVKQQAPTPIPFERHAKVADSIRQELKSTLKIDTFEQLDRLDAEVTTTLDMDAQEAIEAVLKVNMTDPKYLKANGFNTERLLKHGDPSQLTYSFTLYERLPNQNALRVQVDTSPKKLNINESTRLDLGSTAKLRTLITYLDIMSKLYTRISAMSRKEMLEMEILPGDRLTYWARGHLFMRRAKTREDFLKNAMSRKYAASPYQSFLTSGGMHRFGNFNDRYDKRRLTLWQGTRASVNLVFVRLMQDIVRHHRFDKVRPTILTNTDHPKRDAYLLRWAKSDLVKHFNKQWAMWSGLKGDDVVDMLELRFAAEPERLATMLMLTHPTWRKRDLVGALSSTLTPTQLEDFDVDRFLRQHARWSIEDKAYVVQWHPITLWLLKQRRDHPEWSKAQTQEQALKHTRRLYQWLFDHTKLRAQNKFIRVELEKDAFTAIHKQWASMGYPFDDMTPSLASALGASGDRPDALAKMMGILINDGKAQPHVRIKDIHFAKASPYSTRLRYAAEPQPKTILHPVTAKIARQATRLVVKRGTARRINGALGDGVAIGGKTGTGDHRTETLDRWGRVLTSRAIRRSGSFAFFIDDRFFGVMTVYADKDVDDYKFTSSLTVQIVKQLAPVLKKLYQKPPQQHTSTEGVADNQTTTWKRQPKVDSVEDAITVIEDIKKMGFN